MNQPLVSIGIPTYNRPQGLVETLNMLLVQTYQNLEIIVSDNCTPGDEVKNILDEYSRKDGRIKYFIQEENKGITFNYQFLLEKAGGQYFIWCTDDDLKEETFFEKVVKKILETDEVVLGFSNMVCIDTENNVVGSYKDFFEVFESFCSPKALCRLKNYMKLEDNLGKGNIANALFKSEFIKRINLLELVKKYSLVGVDNLFIYQLLCWGNIAIVNEVLHKCRVANKKEYSFDHNLGDGYRNIYGYRLYDVLRNYKGFLDITWSARKINFLEKILQTSLILKLFIAYYLNTFFLRDVKRIAKKLIGRK